MLFFVVVIVIVFLICIVHMHWEIKFQTKYLQEDEMFVKGVCQKNGV